MDSKIVAWGAAIWVEMGVSWGAAVGGRACSIFSIVSRLNYCRICWALGYKLIFELENAGLARVSVVASVAVGLYAKTLNGRLLSLALLSSAHVVRNIRRAHSLFHGLGVGGDSCPHPFRGFLWGEVINQGSLCLILVCMELGALYSCDRKLRKFS